MKKKQINVLSMHLSITRSKSSGGSSHHITSGANQNEKKNGSLCEKELNRFNSEVNSIETKRWKPMNVQVHIIRILQVRVF